MEEIKKLQIENMLLYGHSIDSKPIAIDKKIASIACELAVLDIELSSKPLTPLTKKEMHTRAQRFLESKLTIHPVHYINDFLTFLLRTKNFSSVESLLQIYNRQGQYVSPFNLPLKYTKDRKFYGLLALQSAFYEDKEFLKNMNIALKYIELSKNIHILTPSCYLHEIMHAELVSNKGCIVDFNNSELLSIFMELVYAFEATTEEALRTIEVDKINYFLIEFDNLFKYYYENEGSITEFEALMTSKYVSSTLKALTLFQIYYDGSIAVKKEIFAFIQSILNGNITLEDMLNHYSINEESCCDNSLIKHLKHK